MHVTHSQGLGSFTVDRKFYVWLPTVCYTFVYILDSYALQVLAEFFEIFEAGSQDGYFQEKALVEERNMAQVARQFKTLKL